MGLVERLRYSGNYYKTERRINLAFALTAILLLIVALVLFILAIIFEDEKMGGVGAVVISFGFISAFVYALRIS